MTVAEDDTACSQRVHDRAVGKAQLVTDTNEGQALGVEDFGIIDLGGRHGLATYGNTSLGEVPGHGLARDTELITKLAERGSGCVIRSELLEGSRIRSTSGEEWREMCLESPGVRLDDHALEGCNTGQDRWGKVLELLPEDHQ